MPLNTGSLLLATPLTAATATTTGVESGRRGGGQAEAEAMPDCCCCCRDLNCSSIGVVVVGRLAVAGDRKKRTLNLEICMTKKTIYNKKRLKYNFNSKLIIKEFG